MTYQYNKTNEQNPHIMSFIHNIKQIRIWIMNMRVKKYILQRSISNYFLIVLKAIGCNIHFYLVMKTCFFFHKINQLRNFLTFIFIMEKN